MDPLAQDDRFIAFLGELASGGGTRKSWEDLVVAHYLDPRLEEARRELLRASIAAGDWSWGQPTPNIAGHRTRPARAGASEPLKLTKRLQVSPSGSQDPMGNARVSRRYFGGVDGTRTRGLRRDRPAL
jgi:hypothetical protein